jgi:hypothetical protein
VKSHPHRDLVLINAAGFLRSLGVGLMGVVLGIYLALHLSGSQGFKARESNSELESTNMLLFSEL